MMKKRIVVLSVGLLCSGMVRADDVLSQPAQIDPAMPKSVEEKLAELLTTTEQRAKVAQKALYAEMADVAAAATARLAQAQSFGASECATVQDAIAKYGNIEDRSAAVEAMIVELEGEANTICTKITTLSGNERINLENQLATLVGVKSGLIAAKNDIIQSSFAAEGVLLFNGYMNISNNVVHRRTAEALVGAGAVAAVGAVGYGAVWVFRKVTGA